MSPNPWMGKLWALWNKEKRKPNPALKRENCWGTQKESWTRILGDSQRPGILGICRRRLAGIEIAREYAHEHKEQGWICPISHSVMQKKADELRISTSWKKAWYLRDRREMDHEGRWLGTFQPNREESAHLEKMTKGKAKKWV